MLIHQSCGSDASMIDVVLQPKLTAGSLLFSGHIFLNELIWTLTRDRCDIVGVTWKSPVVESQGIPEMLWNTDKCLSRTAKMIHEIFSHADDSIKSACTTMIDWATSRIMEKWFMTELWASSKSVRQIQDVRHAIARIFSFQDSWCFFIWSSVRQDPSSTHHWFSVERKTQG